MKRVGLPTVIVDDDKICLFTLEQMSRTIGLNVQGTFLSGLQAIEEVRRIRPRLVILDESMPDISGSSLVLIIKRHWPTIKTLVVTCVTEPIRLSKIWSTGVDGLTEKDTHHALQRAIDRILAGDRYLCEVCQHYIDKEKRRSGALIPHMFEILDRMAKGMSYKEIAAELCLSQHTVPTYVKRLMAFTHTHNKAQLVKFGIEKGWVDLH